MHVDYLVTGSAVMRKGFDNYEFDYSKTAYSMWYEILDWFHNGCAGTHK